MLKTKLLKGAKSDIAVLWYLALVKLMLHFFTNGQYGYHVDELYYIACGEHLDWGYTDQPPLIAIIANFSRWMLGDSLFSIRFFPALSGALLVVLTGLMVRQMGGGRFAQCLAAISVIVAPFYLFIDTILTMNAFEPLFWAICAYTVILMVKYRSPQLWLLVGLIVGVGFINKYSMLIFCFSLLAGLFLTPCRKLFLGKWVWLGVFVAVVIVLPNILWQAEHGWPFLEHQKAANLYDKKPFIDSTIDFLFQPIFMMQPLVFPIWLSGLYFYFKTLKGKPYRFLGWTYVIIWGLLIIFRGKYYYLAPIYPILLAGGAIVVEEIIGYRERLKYAVLAVILASTLFFLPIVLPVLPLKTLLHISHLYSSMYEVPNKSSNPLNLQQAPWHYRQMLGWEELVSEVSKVYYSLTPSDRTKTAILTWNYGKAAAIDFFGKTYGLPKAISGAHAYYFWGPRDYAGEIIISIGGNYDYLKYLFKRVEKVETVTYKHTLGIKRNIPIYLCRGIKTPLKDSWPNFKVYFSHVYGKETPMFLPEAMRDASDDSKGSP